MSSYKLAWWIKHVKILSVSVVSPISELTRKAQADFTIPNTKFTIPNIKLAIPKLSLPEKCKRTSSCCQRLLATTTATAFPGFPFKSRQKLPLMHRRTPSSPTPEICWNLLSQLVARLPVRCHLTQDRNCLSFQQQDVLHLLNQSGIVAQFVQDIQTIPKTIHTIF